MIKKNNKRLVRFILEFVGMLLTCQIIMLFLSDGVFSSIKEWSYTTAYSMTIGFILMKGNTVIGDRLESRISWLKAPLKRLFAIVFLGSVFTVVVIFLLNIIFYLLILRLSITDFWYATLFSLRFTLVVYIAITIVVYAFIFYFRWRNLALEHEKQKNETLRLQFEALRNHVNPHFLFNSLSTLTFLIETDQKKAVQFVENLSETYRYIIDNRQRDLVPLHEEMQFVESYLELQNIRYAELIEVRNEVQHSFTQQVIPVSVQMLVENVFKHNVISRQQPIIIRLWIEKDYLYVQNNLHAKSNDSDRTPTGLANIRARYEYLSNRPCVFEERNGAFVVGLPLIKIEEEEK